jgi:CHAT domain-containing protein/ketosteroid isomerase-like protein/TolB-like protein
MKLVPTLSIERAGGAIRYRLDVPERDLGEPLQEEFRHPIDDVTTRALLTSAESLLRSPESSTFAQEAQARGQVLYRTLVPPRLREKLRTVTGPLLISTSLYGLPWELLHDEEEFWGLRYGLGKRLVLDRPLLAGATPRMRARPRALVIGSDPRGDLPFVRHEVEGICETLEPFADIVCVVDRLASFETVAAYLGEGFDLIHYCGHVVSGPDTGPALLLADGRPLSAAVIEPNVAGRPLVFLNACASARERQGPPSGEWEATVSSVAYAFLFGGAVAVVGTLADVSDRHAATLAEAFYRRVLEPTPIGEALRAARAECRRNPESAGSPTWLSFVLYGNPGQTLLRSGTVVPLPQAADPPPALPAPAPVAPVATPAAPVRAPAPVAEPAPRRRVGRIAALAALIALTAVIGVGLFRHTSFAPQRPIRIGVMEVRSRTPGVPAWMKELTRDGLITILGKFPPIQVFSRQMIDFLQKTKGLSEIEAAAQLKMNRMLSASIALDEKLVSLDLDIIDAATGLLVATEHVQGPPDKLMELENELAERTLRALGVTPTPQQLKEIVASRGNETLDVYRLFTETLGEPTAVEEPKPMPHAPEPTPPVPAPGDTSWLFGQAMAWAGEEDGDDAAIRQLLNRYGAALQARDVDQIAALQEQMSDAQRQKLQTYFQIAPDLKVQISGIDVLRQGNEAAATFTRQDEFTDAKTGRKVHLEVTTTGMLRKDPSGDWKIVALRGPQ